MQIFELLFCFMIGVSLTRLIVAPLRSLIDSPKLIFLGIAVIVLGAIFEGLRWQLTPAYLAFSFLALGALKREPSKFRWRILGAIPIALLLLLSIFLGSLMPIVKLPEPDGPYGVGTFGYSLIDESRKERFEPERNRELYMRVWYPSTAYNEQEFPVRTLWQDVYTGDTDVVSFFTHYLSRIDTHSQIDSPIFPDGKFPVLVFNHGFMAPPEQNTLLMEHLASHGYVIFSIAHTHQSTKVILSSSEKILFTTTLPNDLEINEEEVGSSRGIKIFAEGNNGAAHSLLDEQLFTIFDQYRTATNETEKRLIIQDVFDERERYLFGPNATPDALYNYLAGQLTVMSSFAQTWTEDIQYVVNEMMNVDAPISGFLQALDTNNLGIFGHSFGSTAAGEFCKLNDQCKAGIHIDGNYSGPNWSKPHLAPFLVMYSSNFYRGNDFAYKYSNESLLNMTIDGIDHLDFTDLGLLVRGLQGRGMMGDVDNESALNIINVVALSFFDQYLKGKPMPTDLTQRFPNLRLELQED